MRFFSVLFLFAVFCLNNATKTYGNSYRGIKPLGYYSQESHDISSLPLWGPYSKRYAGISHIPQMDKGLRFDFSVMPGYYRNKLLVPHVLFESSYYPWDFSPEMNRFTYRYQLEWKDRVYVDVTYYLVSTSCVLVEMKSVNNTSLPQNIMFNNMAYIDYPEHASVIAVEGAQKLVWYNAIDYANLELIKKTPQYNLVYDGWMRNESLDEKSISRSILSRGFGRETGDKVWYNLPIRVKNGKLLLRYRLSRNQRTSFIVSGLINKTIELTGTGNYEFIELQFNTDKEGEYPFVLQSAGTVAVDFDGFFVGAEDSFKNLILKEAKPAFTPQLIKGNNLQHFMLKYPDIENYYGVAWNYQNSEIRQVLNSELESFFRRRVHNHVSEVLSGDRNWHYTNAYLRPVVLDPDSEMTLYTLISTGEKEKVETDLKSFNDNQDLYVNKIKVLQERSTSDSILPAGKTYLFGKQLLQASVLSNISYPIYTQREYIRHFTPGKNWNSLYTWDLGFIALGLLDIDEEKAFEAIKAYTTPVGSQSAFIHHGTPLPIQMFAYFDLWNLSKNKEVLSFLYPRLKQYYNFMAGHAEGSTTRMKGSNLLRTWDYFYNSGGWDDYPPQHYFHAKDKSSPRVTPVVSTAFYIRAAKILRMAAEELGYKSDMKFYDNEISIFANALQKYAWDEEAGYFGYVTHDEQGNATGIYKYPGDNSNFNKGLDGVSPLVAGICTNEQEVRLIEHLFSENKLWTPVGISTVDQSAPYYKSDGYWNGAVWMPHQWTIWKSLLDCGKGELAYKVAQKALQVWNDECENSNYTFEHFIISSGRGAGWHQFSGLSSPVINFFSSYYKVGKVTVGFEIWIRDDKFTPDFTAYTAEISFDKSRSPRERCMLICLNPTKRYKAFFNNKEIALRSYHAGFVEVTLPSTNMKGTLKIIAEN